MEILTVRGFEKVSFRVEKKSPDQIRAENYVCDSRRTRTPTMGTGIPRSIQLNYGAGMDRKVNIFC